MPEGITKRKLIPVILTFGADPEKGPKAPEKPHVRPASAAPILPHGVAAKVPIVVPVVRSPSESPSEHTTIITTKPHITVSRTSSHGYCRRD